MTAETLGLLRTEAMTLVRVAAYWRVNTKKAAARLARMEGVEVIGEGKGARYCVPVLRMPVAYWLDTGLLVPGIVQNRPESDSRNDRNGRGW